VISETLGGYAEVVNDVSWAPNIGRLKIIYFFLSFFFFLRLIVIIL